MGKITVPADGVSKVDSGIAGEFCNFKTQKKQNI